ncbi:sensor histidine kinase [Smaragdicoccus niigatensis]|uniref:sensor histidine kinase n=1 Tax=Smaragdicoccus niigatensis TaxID=359359 RepID=UPI00138B165B|nr:histidine kinase [Smaragdicoccus niigatensis]
MTVSDRGARAAAMTLFAVTTALVISYVLLSDGIGNEPPLQPGTTALDVGTATSAMSAAAVGLVITWFRPRNPVGWLVSLPGFLLALCDAGQQYGARAAAFPDSGLPLRDWALAVSAPLWIPALTIPATALLVRYPNGNIENRPARWFNGMYAVGMPLGVVLYMGSDNSVSDVIIGGHSPINADGMPGWLWLTLICVAVGLCSVAAVGIIGDAAYRALRSPRPQRVSLLLLLPTAVLAVVLVVLGPWEWLGSLAYFLVLAAIAVGVLQFGATGIEEVVRRSLLYVVLTGLVLGAFVAVAAGLAWVLPSGPTPQIVAAALVAVCLGPARDRVQRTIDRLLYGDRGDPIAAMQRLALPVGTERPDLVPDVLTALAEAVRADSATLIPPGGDGIALRFGGDELGRLVVTPGDGATTLRRADRILVEAVAPMVAAVVHAAALAEDLEIERNRVVAATQEERERLRRELHDGLGPSLTGIGLALAAARRSSATAELLDRLHAESLSALEEVRRIIDDLSPTALDHRSLGAAIRHRSEQLATTVDIQVEASECGTVPPRLVTALYRIADEALTNVVRHSGARSCRVRLTVADRVVLEVADDGTGPGTLRPGGIGLMSMRERTERLGGRFTLVATTPGTTLRADFPLMGSTEFGIEDIP